MATDLAPLLPVTPIRRVIVCGSRGWTADQPISQAIEALMTHGIWEPRVPEIIHGGARGADNIAGRAAHVYNLPERPIFVTPVFDGAWPGAGNRRNERMLRIACELGFDLVLAFKDNFSYAMRRGGTEHMCRIALEHAPPVPVLLYSTARGWERLTLNTPAEVEMLR